MNANTAFNIKAVLVGLAVVIGLAVLIYFAVRTVPENDTSIASCLPARATNIEDHGNNWFTFTWEGRAFLYHRERAGYHLSEALTELQQ